MSQLQYLAVRMYEGERMRWFSKPQYKRLVEILRKSGIPGAAVIRAEEGLDTRGRLQNIHSEYLSDNLPMTVECVGTPENIDKVIQGIQQSFSKRIEGWTTTAVYDVKTGLMHATEVTCEATAPAPQASAAATSGYGILKVYLKETDAFDGIPLTTVLLEGLSRHGIEWTTLLYSIDGFLFDGVIREHTKFSRRNQAPLVLEAVIPPNLDTSGLLQHLQPFLSCISGSAILIPAEFL